MKNDASHEALRAARDAAADAANANPNPETFQALVDAFHALKASAVARRAARRSANEQAASIYARRARRASYARDPDVRAERRAFRCD